jgi:hypothetical protein
MAHTGTKLASLSLWCFMCYAGENQWSNASCLQGPEDYTPACLFPHT